VVCKQLRLSSLPSSAFVHSLCIKLIARSTVPFEKLTVAQVVSHEKRCLLYNHKPTTVLTKGRHLSLSQTRWEPIYTLAIYSINLNFIVNLLSTSKYTVRPCLLRFWTKLRTSYFNICYIPHPSIRLDFITRMIFPMQNIRIYLQKNVKNIPQKITEKKLRFLKNRLRFSILSLLRKKNRVTGFMISPCCLSVSANLFVYSPKIF
jgi:hypothetical protein